MKCKTGRIITRKKKGGEFYYIRLNFVDENAADSKRYSVKDVPTELLVGKRNYQKAVARLNELLESDSFDAGKQMPLFCDFAEMWLKEKQEEWEISTYEAYKYRVHIINTYFANKAIKVSDLTTDMVYEFYSYVRDYRSELVKSGYSNRTMKDICSTFQSIMKAMVKRGYIERNPAFEVPCPHRICDKKERPYLDAEMVPSFLKEIKGHRLETAFLMGLYYGLRREEILGLRWSSIHSNGRLYIENTVVRINTLVCKERTKTDSSFRSYPISENMMKQLLFLKAEQDRHRRTYGADYIESDYIFTWEDGHQYSPDYLTSSFKKLVRKSEILDESLTLHSLRASCVSILIHAGIDIKDVQEWVGHKDIETTLNIYARVNEREKKKVDNKMNEILLKVV